MAPIAVAIINYNTRDLLRNCLASAMAERPNEVVVVDNGSTDGSPAMVRAEFPKVTLCADEGNPGFGGGANRAFAQCRSPYVLLLNSDTTLVPGVLRELSAYLDRSPRVGVVGPRLRNPDGSLQPSCFPFPTPLYAMLDLSGLDAALRFVPLLRQRYLRTWAHDQARTVPWVLGAAMAIRRSAFDAAGGFDETFFMYSEEVDFCYRLRQAGWETHFASVGSIYHVGGASTIQQRSRMAIRAHESTLAFYRRHYSAAQLAQLRTVMAATMLAKILRDSVGLLLTRDQPRRGRLAQDVAIWRQVLAETWRA